MVGKELDEGARGVAPDVRARGRPDGGRHRDQVILDEGLGVTLAGEQLADAGVGREGVTVRPLDRAQLADRQISRDFLAVAAPGLAPDDAIRDIVSNRSLSMEALALADALAASEPAFCGTGRNPGRGSRDWLHDIAGAPVTLEAAWEDLIDDLGRADLAWLKQDWGIVLPRPKRAARDGLWSPKAVSSLARTLNRMSLAAGP